MGAYVSLEHCRTHYNVTLNCAINYTNALNTTYDVLGNIEKGQFEGDGDVAGIGIVGSFLAVTSLALAASFVSICLRMWKHKVFPFIWRPKTPARLLDRIHEKATSAPRHSIKPSLADMFESIVLACSDTQIFTGAAYAITLRYFMGCTVSAYHYNIIANMMLLTCATHLMAITVVRDYWKYPWLAVLRVVLKLGVFLVTGILLSNQNAEGLLDPRTEKRIPFPSRVPLLSEPDSYYFLAAACFQSSSTKIGGVFGDSFEDLDNSVTHSTPGNHIEGWNKYLVIVLWFTASFTAELGMFIRRGHNNGAAHRKRLINWFWRSLVGLTRAIALCCRGNRRPTNEEVQTTEEDSSAPRAGEKKVVHRLKITGHYILSVYALGGIGICAWTVTLSGNYMMRLRKWVHRSDWMKNDEYGNNVENDATSFGQLVPICTCGLVVFAFLQEWSTWWSNRREAKYTRQLEERLDDVENSPSVQSGSTAVTDGHDPSKPSAVITQTSIPPTPGLEISNLSPHPVSPSSQSPPPAFYSLQNSSHPQYFVQSHLPPQTSGTPTPGQQQHQYHYQLVQQQGNMQQPSSPSSPSPFSQSQQQGTSPPQPIFYAFTPVTHGQELETTQSQPASPNLTSTSPPQTPPTNTQASFVVESPVPPRPTSELPSPEKPAEKPASEEPASEKPTQKPSSEEPVSEKPTSELPTSKPAYELPTSDKPPSPKSPTRKPVGSPSWGRGNEGTQSQNK